MGRGALDTMVGNPNYGLEFSFGGIKFSSVNKIALDDLGYFQFFTFLLTPLTHDFACYSQIEIKPNLSASKHSSAVHLQTRIHFTNLIFPGYSSNQNIEGFPLIHGTKI